MDKMKQLCYDAMSNNNNSKVANFCVWTQILQLV